MLIYIFTSRGRRCVARSDYDERREGSTEMGVTGQFMDRSFEKIDAPCMTLCGINYGVVDYILPTMVMMLRGLLTPSQLTGVAKILWMSEVRRGAPGRSECCKLLMAFPWLFRKARVGDLTRKGYGAEEKRWLKGVLVRPENSSSLPRFWDMPNFRFENSSSGRKERTQQQLLLKALL
jgi:hypothetical protein